MRLLRWAVAVALAVMHAGTQAAATCPASAEEAASQFVTRAVEDPGRSVELLEARSLARFRARLSQLLDARYSPMSSPFREKLFGAEWSFERLGTLSDAALVERYLTGGSQLRGKVTLDRLSARVTRRDARWGDEVTVQYVVGSSVQERRFSAHEAAQCWRLEVPAEAWARLDQLAKVFKESRAGPPPREGPALLPFLAAEASTTPRPGMREMKQRHDASPVWVSEAPILTEANIAGAQADWECEMGFSPEETALRLRLDDAGTRALKAWSERHLGSMMAVALDGEVVTVARVASVLGDRLSLCMHGSSLEQAQEAARLLRGLKPPAPAAKP